MLSQSDNRMTRVGVVYDGGYFSRVSDYYRFAHNRQSRISIGGLQNFVRNEISAAERVDVRYCRIVDSHYFRGRFSVEEAETRGTMRGDRIVDDVLMWAGVTTHYLPRRFTQEKGIDVWLALEAFELAINKSLDVLVLVAGDGDFLPLIRKLNALGTRVMLLAWDCEWIYRGEQRSIGTAQTLIDEATYAVMMHDVIDDRSRRSDPSVNDLFISSQRLGQSSTLSPREGESDASTDSGGDFHRESHRPRLPDPPDEYIRDAYGAEKMLSGKVYTLRASAYGFIEENETGYGWFFHKDNLLSGFRYEEIKVDMPVQFNVDFAGPEDDLQAVDVEPAANAE